MFIQRKQANSFCVEFQIWHSNHTRNLHVFYGTLHSSRHCLALNHLITIGIYYLYINASAKHKSQFCEFTSVVHDKLLLLDKHIAFESDEQETFFLNGASYKTTSSLHSVIYFLFLLFFLFYSIRTMQMESNVIRTNFGNL